jgi:ribonuclease P protein component
MLRKNRRITTKNFPSGKTGKLFSAPHFSLKAVSSPDSLVARFAVVVSKKVATKAVKRNHLRRVIYESIGTLHIRAENVMIIIYAKKDAGTLRYSQVVHEVGGLARTAGLL